MTRRLRAGEWLAGAGGLALIASLFLPWYGDATAWRTFSVLDVVLTGLALVPLALVVLQATRESPSLPVAFSVLTVVTGILATLLVVLRILDQPGQSDTVDVRTGAWLGLAAAVLVTVGGWRSLRTEAVRGAPAPPVLDLPRP